METVEPIRDLKKIDALKKYLYGTGNMRNYALIVFGINTALRISDVLSLTWEDVYDFDLSKLKSHVWVKEEKTGKVKKFYINKSAQNALNSLLKNKGKVLPYEYVFKSREGQNRPLTRTMALYIVKDAAAAVGVKENIGCHSLRKTFGYHSWKKGVPLALLTELYNHSNQTITKRYLGISQDDIDDVYKLVEL